jgi:hypothetical protein
MGVGVQEAASRKNPKPIRILFLGSLHIWGENFTWPVSAREMK